ncbi:hypothetical protein JZ751_013584 [Albula glossodonta]|uniref:RRM domain-containing protein n=1 Tax=Albula glossodonta TaxID=121402 RepID=A0A8T2NVV6_9TELE|nr:hypothetical protein JZ751_013584 [Albula glossodonta]
MVDLIICSWLCSQPALTVQLGSLSAAASVLEDWSSRSLNNSSPDIGGAGGGSRLSCLFQRVGGRAFKRSPLTAIRGREITVQLQPTDALLCVTNLPHTFTAAQFQELARIHGNLERCFLAYSERTGHSKGYGFVEYMKKDSASRARSELLGHRHGDHTLMAQWADANRLTAELIHSRCLRVDRLPADLCDSEELARIFSIKYRPVFCQLLVCGVWVDGSMARRSGGASDVARCREAFRQSSCSLCQPMIPAKPHELCGYEARLQPFSHSSHSQMVSAYIPSILPPLDEIVLDLVRMVSWTAHPTLSQTFIRVSGRALVLAQEEDSHARGFAVLEYEMAEHAEAVLMEMDRQPIRGQEVHVSLCAPGTSGRSTLAALIAAQGMVSVPLTGCTLASLSSHSEKVDVTFSDSTAQQRKLLKLDDKFSSRRESKVWNSRKGLLPEPSVAQLLGNMSNPAALQALLRPHLHSSSSSGSSKHSGKFNQPQGVPYLRPPLAAALFHLGKVQQNLLQIQLAQQQLLHIKDKHMNPVTRRITSLCSSSFISQIRLAFSWPSASVSSLLGDPSRVLLQKALGLQAAPPPPAMGQRLLGGSPTREWSLPEGQCVAWPLWGTHQGGSPQSHRAVNRAGSLRPCLRAHRLSLPQGTSRPLSSAPKPQPNLHAARETSSSATSLAVGQTSLLGEPPKEVKLPSNPYLNLASVLPGMVLQGAVQPSLAVLTAVDDLPFLGWALHPRLVPGLPQNMLVLNETVPSCGPPAPAGSLDCTGYQTERPVNDPVEFLNRDTTLSFHTPSGLPRHPRPKPPGGFGTLQPLTVCAKRQGESLESKSGGGGVKTCESPGAGGKAQNLQSRGSIHNTNQYSPEGTTDYTQHYSPQYSQEAMQHWYQQYQLQGCSRTALEGAASEYSKEHSQGAASTSYGDYITYSQAIGQLHSQPQVTPATAHTYHRDTVKEGDTSKTPTSGAPQSIANGNHPGGTLLGYSCSPAMSVYVTTHNSTPGPTAQPHTGQTAADWSQFYYVSIFEDYGNSQEHESSGQERDGVDVDAPHMANSSDSQTRGQKRDSSQLPVPDSVLDRSYVGLGGQYQDYSKKKRL